jgi:predicted ATPase
MPPSPFEETQEMPEKIIRTPDQRLRVFVSSTLKELAQERQAASQAIKDLRLTPVLFELGARPHPPRRLYRAYLAQSHIFLGIYWQSYGWAAPDMQISGLEDEYRLAEKLPKLIYFKSPAPDQEPGLQKLIKRIKSDDKVSYRYFSDAEELRQLIGDDLAVMLSESFEQAHLQFELPESISQESEPRRVNLPQPLTTLVGREQEIKALEALLSRPHVRLVTLIGPGGVGKTRLSLEVAASLAHAFEQGVYWVDLAAINDPVLVVSAIAKVLDVRERGGAPLFDSLKQYLRDKRILLVLDNFEQVLGAASLVSELLASAAGLKTIVTSRSSLRLQGEHEFPVPPLQVPEALRLISVETVAHSAAARLFIERAQAVIPNFQMNKENAAVVAEIVRKLEGLPLAIELAAARLKYLPPKQILERLSNRLQLLTGGARDLPLRQQTMRNVIEWSHDLLNESQRSLFYRLGAFVGGFTLEAVETICNPDGELDVLGGVAALLDNSLLRQENSMVDQPRLIDQPRFSMLETIREYALEQLVENGEAAQIRQRHGEYFSELASQADPNLFSEQGEYWLDRLEMDYGNFRTAWEWTQTSSEYNALGWNIVFGLTWFWYRRSYLNEGRQWYQRAVEQSRTLGKSALRGHLLTSAGLVAMWQSDFQRAGEYMDEGLQILREVGSPSDLSRALFASGVLAVNQGEDELAQSLLGEAFPIFQTSGQRWFQAITQLHLGNIALFQKKIDTAQEYMQQSLALGRSLGDRWLSASAINNFGEFARYRGDHDQAERYYQESRDLFLSIRSFPDVARADHSLAWVAYARGDFDQARTLFLNALDLHQQLGIERGAAECVQGLCAVLGALGQREEAVRLLSAARARFEALKAGIWPADNADFQRSLEIIRSELDEAAFKSAWELGKTMSFDQALASTRQLAD